MPLSPALAATSSSTDPSRRALTAAPLRRVLVASDFSAHARSAGLRAMKLPLAEGAEVRLVHVSSSAADLPSDAESLARDATALAAKARGVALTSELLVGDPAREIVRAARALGADLVVIGAHSRRGMLPGLGGVANRVVRRASTAVLVVRGRPARASLDALRRPSAYARPLVGLDLSDLSAPVLATAYSVVGRAASVVVVHAYHVPFEGYVATASSKGELEGFRRHYRDEARRRATALLATLDARADVRVRKGEPCSVLAREIEERDADVVVVGTHGRSGVARFFLGSVAQWLLENAPCDVLVARTQPFARD